MNKLQKFLFLSGLGTTLIALSYGVIPEASLPSLYDITANQVSESQVFRAIMGLYLGFSGLWILAAFNNGLTQPATYTLIIFMWGLASPNLSSVKFFGDRGTSRAAVVNYRSSETASGL